MADILNNNTNDFIDSILAGENTLTSAQMTAVIRKLMAERDRLKKKELSDARKTAKQLEKEINARKQEEHILDVTSMDLPLDWDNPFDEDCRAVDVHADNISDGLVYSLNNLGKVDIEYISSVTGEDYKSVICALKGSIYQNPAKWKECFYKGWETAEEYLSGDVLEKLDIAIKANDYYKGYFEDNVTALKTVAEDMAEDSDIYATLGSPWIPTDVIDEFIEVICGDPLKRWVSGTDKAIFATKHDEITGTWELPLKNRYGRGIACNHTYGTYRINALEIIEKTLNLKEIAVYETNISTGKKTINQADTLAALDKQKKIVKEFNSWLWADSVRSARLKNIFYSQFRPKLKRRYSGAFLQFPEMSEDVQLYPYQKDAVARILFSPNVLLAHEVGCGKTYIMIAAGMELKRMGLSQKNMYVVPNNIIGQWHAIFMQMYPDAKVLCVDPQNFTPSRRKSILYSIKEDDYDAVIIAYSCFEKITLSTSLLINKFNSLKAEVNAALANKTTTTRALIKRHEKIIKELAKLESLLDEESEELCFDKLGITRLFVDEAHNFKNVPIENTNGARGINCSGSKKCQDMLDKVHMIQRQNGGGGVVMATGTPITNSISDIYTFQRYLQHGQLKLTGLENFDSWVGMFAEKSLAFEIDVDTSSYRYTLRLSKFHNLPQLTTMIADFADFHKKGKEADIPYLCGYDDVLVRKTPKFSEYLENISKRVDGIRRRRVGRYEDNMLKITTDGRKAALDLRLVNIYGSSPYLSKSAYCARNVYDIYCETANQRSTQLIFCDTSVPKDSFNIYDEMRQLLVNLGVPSYEIAFIHDAYTEEKREKLFRDVKNGIVRILIGSTFKLGIGVNVQDRLVALHHLDVPWRPADITQREGRILRQGNRNGQVYIYRYITEGSFDAYSWQLLETKQNFIAEILSGCTTRSECEDISETALNYGEVKALAVGNPLIKLYVEKSIELKRLYTLQAKINESRSMLRNELLELPYLISNQENLIEKCTQDTLSVVGADTYTNEQRKYIREKLADAIKDNIMYGKERTLMEYRGFNIVLPSNMTADKPYIWIVGNGRYRVELDSSDVGNLIRTDNCIGNLDKHLANLKDGLDHYKARQQGIIKELDNLGDFTEDIELCKQKLSDLSMELGDEM